jgi:hypothetical protein
MYLVFFLLVPAVIFCLRRKGWWLVLLASATVWLLTQLAVTDALKNQFLGGMFGWFNILGWQVLFIFGMVFGYYRSDCNLWSRFGKKSFFLAAALAAVLFVFRHKLLPHSDVFHSEFLIGKPRLGPVRVLNFAVLAVVFSRPQIWPSHALWTRMLSLLGRNSLPVFSFHIVLMYLVRCFVVPHVTATQTNMAFLAVATVVLLYLPASLAEVLNYLNVQGEVSTPSS